MGVECDAFIIEYFFALFSSSGYQNYARVVDTIMHKWMTKWIPSSQWILVMKRSLWQWNKCTPTKPLSLDGMAPIFYQHFWHIINKNVCEVVTRALHRGMCPNALNHTYITLILKKKGLENVFDFWPINLCNVLYKIVAKVLANRLKLILPWIISPTQSAFVFGRLITGNVLIAYETMHYLN